MLKKHTKFRSHKVLAKLVNLGRIDAFFTVSYSSIEATGTSLHTDWYRRLELFKPSGYQYWVWLSTVIDQNHLPIKILIAEP